MHNRTYVLIRFYQHKIFTIMFTITRGKRSNTMSMIAKLYVVTYIPLKSQKSAIARIPGERDQRGNAARRGCGSRYLPVSKDGNQLKEGRLRRHQRTPSSTTMIRRRCGVFAMRKSIAVARENKS